MATVLVPDTASLVLHGELNGQEIINTIYARKTNSGPWTPELLKSAIDVFMDAMGNHLQFSQSNQYHLLEGIATDLGVYGGAQYVESDITHLYNGAVDSPSLPGGSAFVVKFLTGRVGRSFRGRNFIAGIPESQSANGVVSGTFIENALAAYDAISGGLNALLVHWVVVSRQFAGSPVVPAATYNVTGVGYTTNAIRSQRKRNVGIGA